MNKKTEWSELSEIINLIAKHPEVLPSILPDLFTQKELSELSKRWLIIKLLNEGVPQHEIAKKLGVGVATVTRGSRFLKDPKSGFNQILKIYDTTRNKKK